VRQRDRDRIDERERRGAGERLERRAGERVLTGPAVHQATLDLLGGHVAGGAEESARAGEATKRPGGLAQPEVRQVDVVRPATARAGVQQHVRGLDVAVHEAAPVRGVQGGRHLRDDAGGAARAQRPLPARERVNVPAGHVAHRDEEDLVRLARLEDRDDVRVIHRGRSP